MEIVRCLGDSGVLQSCCLRSEQPAGEDADCCHAAGDHFAEVAVDSLHVEVAAVESPSSEAERGIRPGGFCVSRLADGVHGAKPSITENHRGCGVGMCGRASQLFLFHALSLFHYWG